MAAFRLLCCFLRADKLLAASNTFLFVLARQFSASNASIGGAICITGEGSAGVLNVTQTSFLSNTAATAGAAMVIKGLASVGISQSTFTGNTVTTAGKGGALDVESSDSVWMDSNFFRANSAENGGAVYFTDIASPPIFTNVNASSNTCA